MPFNYEQSVWGRGEAGLEWSSPASFRLKQALFALRGIPVDGKILEVGCGAGQFIRAIKNICPASHCYGCDISHRAIAEAGKRGDGVEYAVSQPGHIPYADSSFDAILIFDVLEHVENPALLLGEISRVLKPGGILYCFVPCEGDNLSLWHWLDMAGLKKDVTRIFAGHINYFSREQISSIFRESNFQIRQLRYSEHLLGQLLGVLSFYLMSRHSKNNPRQQTNNEECFAQIKNNYGILGDWLRKLINSVIYLESLFFSRVLSPNAHFIVINNKKV